MRRFSDIPSKFGRIRSDSDEYECDTSEAMCRLLVVKGGITLSGSDFVNPLSGSQLHGVRGSYPSNQKPENKQAKINDLKARVTAGTYALDLQKLSNRIQKSGVLNEG